MRPQNKRLVSIDTIFTIHEKKYKVLKVYEYIGIYEPYKWVIRPMAGGRDFLKEAVELDKTLRKHKQENQHLLFEVNL